MPSKEFRLSWDDHPKAVVGSFEKLLNDGSLVDCTIAAEGCYLKAHRVVLSACSPYFETLFKQENEKNPIVVLKDVKFKELKAIIEFMYCGTVQMPKDRLKYFVETAESLQVSGLMNPTRNKPHSKTRERLCREQRSFSQICSTPTRSYCDIEVENASASSPLTETADESNRCNDVSNVLSSCNVNNIPSIEVLQSCRHDEERTVPPTCLSLAGSTTSEQTPELPEIEAVFLLEPELEQTDEDCMQFAANPDVLAETMAGDIFSQEITVMCSVGAAAMKEEARNNERQEERCKQEQRQERFDGREPTNGDVSSFVPLRTLPRSPPRSQSRSGAPLHSPSRPCVPRPALSRSPSPNANANANSPRRASGEAGKRRTKSRERRDEARLAVRLLALGHGSRMAFGCQECGQTLPSKKALAEHRRRHRRERPYKCEACGEQFAQLSFLVLHRRGCTSGFSPPSPVALDVRRHRPPLRLADLQHPSLSPQRPPYRACRSVTLERLRKCFRDRKQFQRDRLQPPRRTQ